MPVRDRLQMTRDAYGAYVRGDRAVIEGLLSEDFVFYSPADVGIDRARYFERCWPNAESMQSMTFERLVELEDRDEVLVTYATTRTDGSRFRNTEVLAFDGDKICRTDVYFGWNVS